MVDNECNVQHCGCNVTYIAAQGNCLVCYATTPENQAIVQFLLDGNSNIYICLMSTPTKNIVKAEMAQCEREGIPVNFSLSLPPPAEALVRIYTRESEGNFSIIEEHDL